MTLSDNVGEIYQKLIETPRPQLKDIETELDSIVPEPMCFGFRNLVLFIVWLDQQLKEWNCVGPSKRKAPSCKKYGQPMKGHKRSQCQQTWNYTFVIKLPYSRICLLIFIVPQVHFGLPPQNPCNAHLQMGTGLWSYCRRNKARAIFLSSQCIPTQAEQTAWNWAQEPIICTKGIFIYRTDIACSLIYYFVSQHMNNMDTHIKSVIKP